MNVRHYCIIIGFLCLQDIDECNASNNNCHPQAHCCNTEGSFVCACNEGYIGDGVKCCRRSNTIEFVNRIQSISKLTRKHKHKHRHGSGKTKKHRRTRVKVPQWPVGMSCM